MKTFKCSPWYKHSYVTTNKRKYNGMDDKVAADVFIPDYLKYALWEIAQHFNYIFYMDKHDFTFTHSD